MPPMPSARREGTGPKPQAGPASWRQVCRIGMTREPARRHTVQAAGVCTPAELCCGPRLRATQAPLRCIPPLRSWRNVRCLNTRGNQRRSRPQRLGLLATREDGRRFHLRACERTQRRFLQSTGSVAHGFDDRHAGQVTRQGCKVPSSDADAATERRPQSRSTLRRFLRGWPTGSQRYAWQPASGSWRTAPR